MAKDPAFLFYSADFLVGVSDLTMAERGQYITLLCLQHTKGHLSKKNIQISLGSISEDVLAKFSIDESGCYYNERLEAEVIKRKAYSESRRENIMKRWQNSTSNNDTYVSQNEYICNTQGDTSVLHMENEIININTNLIDIEDNTGEDINNEFIPPTYEQVEEYAIKRDRLDLAKTFYDYYTEGNWRDKDGNEVTAWKQKFVAWESRNPKKDEDKGSFDTDDFFQTALNRSYGK